MSVSEIGFTPGKEASSVRAFDNVESRKGYSGLYQFGAACNPGNFTAPGSATPRSGNFLLYWMASQALWRVGSRSFVVQHCRSRLEMQLTNTDTGMRVSDARIGRG